jgi:hypothetical protein
MIKPLTWWHEPLSYLACRLSRGEHGPQRLALWAKWVHGKGAILETADKTVQ